MEHSYSLLIIKPEFHRLLPNDQKLLNSCLKLFITRKVLEKLLVLKYDEAMELWAESVGSFPWARDYYNAMSEGTSRAMIIEGDSEASMIKGRVRKIFLRQIKDMSRSAGLPFKLDLVHGSDPGEFVREASLIGIIEEMRMAA